VNGEIYEVIRIRRGATRSDGVPTQDIIHPLCLGQYGNARIVARTRARRRQPVGPTVTGASGLRPGLSVHPTSINQLKHGACFKLHQPLAFHWHLMLLEVCFILPA
jgi:hypothetical protein